MTNPQTAQTPTGPSTETLDQVRAIIHEQCGAELSAITRHSRFDEDLDCDALWLLEIVFGCEEAFGIEIPNHVVDLIETAGAVHDLVDYIDAALMFKKGQGRT